MKTLYRLSVITLLLAIAIFSCEDKKQKSFDKLIKKHIISKDQGVAMFKEFQNNRTDIVEPILQRRYNDTTFEDTKFVWFSLEDMKEYIAFLDAIQEENPKKDITGLRIYFAAYPNSKEYEGKTIKHPKQQTFFMIPTVNSGWTDSKNVNLNHLPFIVKPKGKNPLKGDFEIVQDLMLDFDKLDRYNSYNKSFKIQEGNFNIISTFIQGEEHENEKTTSTIYNEGEMSPPPNKKI